ncbi:hypothetical protein SAMN05443247_01838 [Bradyrhizobium erythrophlei]|jgi:hypothetical protein|nr:hypothetical protein SAMN05443247_01838 [Bradyrhizobium erythrophlei]
MPGMTMRFAAIADVHGNYLALVVLRCVLGTHM